MFKTKSLNLFHWPFCSSNCWYFSDFFASIVLHFFMEENHLFLLSSACYYSVSWPFFVLRSCHGDLMARDTKHVIKINEWSQWWEWPPRTDEIIFSWRTSEHDRRSELMDQNQPKRMRRLIIFRQRFSKSMFLVIDWLVCVTQTARRTPASQYLSSSPQILSLHSYSLYVYSRRATWDRSLAERLGNLWRRSWTWRIKFFCWRRVEIEQKAMRMVNNRR